MHPITLIAAAVAVTVVTTATIAVRKRGGRVTVSLKSGGKTVVDYDSARS